jgi:CDP-diacylglycerol--glycerol-3-phosphate 3-phosphatidyltransferase
MAVYAVKPHFQRLLRPVADTCVRLRIGPTAINFAGLLVSLVMALSLVWAPIQPLLYWALPLGAFARTACNALDGMVARGLGVSSAMGEVCNEFLDRVSDAAIFAALPLTGHGHMGLGLAALASVLLVSYLGIAGKSAGGRRVYSGLLGKPDRMILLGAFAIAEFYLDAPWLWDAFLGVVAVASLITMAQRLATIRKDLRHADHQ